MKLRILFITAVFLYMSVIPFAFSFELKENPSEFIRNNPDGNKYDFAKAFITSLEGIKSSVERSQNSQVVSPQDILDAKKISELVDYLTLDNVKWRVAKNMMKKYLIPDNGLMLKVAHVFIKMCDEQIFFNVEERKLLQQIQKALREKKIKDFNQQLFLREHKKLSEQRKESLKGLLESALLTCKVMVSTKQNIYGEFDSLGITSKERDRLIYKMDNFYGENYDGELRAGQSFLEGSVSVIKELLFDYSWHSIDE
ncbi:MAG: hypothetical protein HQL27_05840 [Candidatus Omnitrophica bacterium]|nr:hypothetical protein [Candidatus Omnitrophota bacterium]